MARIGAAAEEGGEDHKAEADLCQQGLIIGLPYASASAGSWVGGEGLVVSPP